MTQEKNVKRILLLGSGYVAGPCLQYLAQFPSYAITVASRRLEKSNALVKGVSAPKASLKAISLHMESDKEMETAIAQHDLVISLLPYTHHPQVIQWAIQHKKHVVTTSYVSPAMQELHEKAKAAGITVLNEIGLDPGIDHLYAIKTIDEVHKEGGKILSFLSYCGGLPAPEASNNPLGYKFSWSSRGVLLALKNSAKYLQDGKVVNISSQDLMGSAKPIPIYPAFNFVGYPNRDSTPYSKRYAIPECQTLVRGTLRYAVFPEFVKVLVKLGFLEDTPVPELDPESDGEVTWKAVTAKALGCSTQEETLKKAILEKAGLKAGSEHAETILHGLKWLGLLSSTPVYKKGNLLDTLCATLEDKMAYAPGERDMVMLQHKFVIQTKQGKTYKQTCTGLWYGEPKGPSAMAKTVGVPCGIAVDLVLKGKIKEKGVLAPMSTEIVYPILEELEKQGIKMVDEVFE